MSNDIRSLKSHKNASYLKFLRVRPCCVTNWSGDVVAHHVRCLGGGGMGIKPSDYLAVPLLTAEHVKLHNIGEKTYWAAAGIDPVDVIRMNLLVYLCGWPIDGSKALPAVMGLIESLR